MQYDIKNFLNPINKNDKSHVIVQGSQTARISNIK